MPLCQSSELSLFEIWAALITMFSPKAHWTSDQSSAEPPMFRPFQVIAGSSTGSVCGAARMKCRSLASAGNPSSCAGELWRHRQRSSCFIAQRIRSHTSVCRRPGTGVVAPCAFQESAIVAISKRKHAGRASASAPPPLLCPLGLFSPSAPAGRPFNGGHPCTSDHFLRHGRRGRNCAETKHLRPFGLPYEEELRIDKEPIM
jgi:hypothetical protein